jgi:hypothetical protein
VLKCTECGERRGGTRVYHHLAAASKQVTCGLTPEKADLGVNEGRVAEDWKRHKLASARTAQVNKLSRVEVSMRRGWRRWLPSWLREKLVAGAMLKLKALAQNEEPAPPEPLPLEFLRTTGAIKDVNCGACLRVLASRAEVPVPDWRPAASIPEDLYAH